MKQITKILLVACCVTSALANEAKDWLTAVDESNLIKLAGKDNKLAENQVYECKVTRLGTAVSRLKDNSYLELDEKMAAYYAGHSYRAKDGHTAYLVRGAFTHYTGKFALYFKDGSLLVRHSSLGRDIEPNFCPLIVQLPSKPKEIFVQVGGAR